MTSEGGQKLRGKPYVVSWQKDTEEKAMYMQQKTEQNDELERLRRRYAGRAKAGKGRLLDEFCEHHVYERKYAIKLLQGGAAAVASRPRSGPEPVLGVLPTRVGMVRR